MMVGLLRHFLEYVGRKISGATALSSSFSSFLGLTISLVSSFLRNLGPRYFLYSVRMRSF